MEPQLNIAKQYNQHFMKLLRDYESKGKIKILEELARWADNNHNMRDDAGLIIWGKNDLGKILHITTNTTAG